MNQNCSFIPLRHIIYRKPINVRDVSGWDGERLGIGRPSSDIVYAIYITQISVEETLNTSSVPSNKLESKSTNKNQNIKTKREDRSVFTIIRQKVNQWELLLHTIKEIVSPEKRIIRSNKRSKRALILKLHFLESYCFYLPVSIPHLIIACWFSLGLIFVWTPAFKDIFLDQILSEAHPEQWIWMQMPH